MNPLVIVALAVFGIGCLITIITELANIVEQLKKVVTELHIYNNKN